MAFLILTDILEEKSLLMADDEKGVALASRAFKVTPDDSGFLDLPGVMSRKKQVVPVVAAALKEMRVTTPLEKFADQMSVAVSALADPTDEAYSSQVEDRRASRITITVNQPPIRVIELNVNVSGGIIDPQVTVANDLFVRQAGCPVVADHLVPPLFLPEVSAG